MTGSSYFIVIRFIFGLLLLAGIIKLFRRMYLERLQENLFELRDSLFILAAENKTKFGFNNNDYIFFRKMFNRAIRYAERNNVFSMLMAALALRSVGLRFDAQNYRKEINERILQYPQPLSEKLTTLVQNYDWAVYRYLNRTSIIYFLIFRIREFLIFTKQMKISIKPKLPASFIEDIEYEIATVI
ncbi:MAG: hypothetical protein ACR2PY_07895 [Salinispira sp.]